MEIGSACHALAPEKGHVQSVFPGNHGAHDLDACGFEPVGHGAEQLFADALKAGKEEGREEVIISNNAWACQRSVIWDKWLAMRTYHTGYKPFPEYMLFDLEADPQEAVNLADAHPEILSEGMRRLEKWTSDMLDTSDTGMDPMRTVMREGGPFHANDNSPEIPNYLGRLRTTGREYYADWLKENGSKPVPADAPWAAALKPGQTYLKKPFAG